MHMHGCAKRCLFRKFFSFLLLRASGSDRWNGCERGIEKTSEWRGRNGVSVAN